MIRFWPVAWLVAGACGLLIHVSAATGEKKVVQPEKKQAEPPKEIVVNGELINADLKDRVLTQSFCKTYVFKMTAGHTYQIDMQTRAFDAYLRLENPKGDQVAADDDGGGMLNARILYRAPVTGDFTICAMSLGGGSVGKFTLIVKDTTPPGGAKLPGKPVEIKNEKGQGKHTGKLDQMDEVYKGKKHKLFTFNMEEGKTYQIDMVSGAFDSYLFLESPDGELLAQDDDGGGFPNARITFKAAKTGKHRVICTHFGGGGNLGEFTLTLHQTDPAPRDEKK